MSIHNGIKETWDICGQLRLPQGKICPLIPWRLFCRTLQIIIVIGGKYSNSTRQLLRPAVALRPLRCIFFLQRLTQNVVLCRTMKSALLLLPTLLFPCLLGAAETLTSEQANFFEKQIRPVLVDKCYRCHGPDTAKPKGGLRLDTREATRRGGQSGPAVVPGDVAASLLLDAISYTNADSAMPPTKAGGKLADSVIADFTTWVKMGAPDPREPAAPGAPEPVPAKSLADYGEATQWWAWQLPVATPPPSVFATAWPRGAVDQYVLVKLEEKQLAPAADADAATWLRRVYFDLIGLPPRPQETMDFVKAWVADAEKARTEAVDKLLATPQYGERWARHWLDVARYGESSGRDTNMIFSTAWRYRDYVIGAFNADLPFDRFLTEQLAGDLLPAADAKAKAQQQIATGFLALGTKALNEMNPAQFALDVADEQIDTVSQAFMATTIACARCHDHKFDPIPQREYYALAGIFLSTDTRYGTAGGIQNRHATDLLELPTDCALPRVGKAVSASELQTMRDELAKLTVERDALFRENMASGKAPAAGTNQLRRLFLIARTGQLEADLKLYDTGGANKLLCMGVVEQPTERVLGTGRDFVRRRIQERIGRPAEFSKITDSPIFIRGDVAKPTASVPRGFVSVLSKGTVPSVPTKASGRLELAQWMTSGSNPLTARVMVNRVWSWLFGRGLVSTMDNFGTTGERPANLALLDHQALHFTQDLHWSVKLLVRELTLSHTYAQSSTYDDHAFHVDPDNALCWRMTPRRLEAECLRDAMLGVSSALDLRPPAGSGAAYYGEAQIGGPRAKVVADSGLTNAAGNYRSIYLPAARDALPEALDVFDAPDGNFVTGRREVTNTPSQALFLMNSPFVKEQAEKFATKLLSAIPGSGPNAGMQDKLAERVRWAYGLCFSRSPAESEIYAAQAFFSRCASEPKSTPQAAWTSFCRALFGTAEFRELN